MNSSCKAGPATARLLVVCVGVIALAGTATAFRAFAATAVPFEKLSMRERLNTAPDSTIVKVGPRTTTLGQLRAAHRAREATLLRAGSLGVGLRGKPIPVAGGGVRAVGVGHPGVGNMGNPQLVPQAVVEPPSQYASAPADMKAFCSAAQASACLYLPPDQYVSAAQSGVADWDGLVTQSQCAQEGGGWGDMWGGTYCAFNYPGSVTVHFTPAANYKLTQSASCDRRTFAYTVDVHGAITISLTAAMWGIMTTDDNPTCVVSVTPGG
jgi:hypothetical protein